MLVAAMPKSTVFVLLVLAACTQSGPPEHQQVQALQAATEELQAARAAFEADGAATRDALDKVRGELVATQAKLAAIVATLDEPTRPRAPDVPSLLRSPADPTPDEARDISAGIRCASETHCTIDRSFIDAMLTNPATLARQARIVPSQHEGEMNGFKLYGIRPGSIPKALGLQNGDLLTEINGNALGSVDGALELYSRLRTATKLTLAIVRRGKPFTLTLEVAEASE
jgi:general secretion pathway protein C